MLVPASSATRVAALTLIASASLVSHSFAQTPVITSVPANVAAGPDFATDVLANPWDFSDVLDLSPFPDEFLGWTITNTSARTIGRSAFLGSGQFVGHTATGGESLVPLLYRGGAYFLTSAHENSGVFDHKAVPTAGYGKLAVAMTLSASTALNSQLSAYWFATPYSTSAGYAGGVAFRVPQAGTHIYIVDLVTGAWTDARGNPRQPFFFPVGPAAPIAWNGAPLMRGFQVRPTSDPNAQVDVSIDWVRLTQRDGLPGAAMLPLVFANCANREYSVEALAGSSWEVIHTGTASGGSTTTAAVNYGVLAPGTWSLRVTCYPSGRGAAGVSSAAASVTINSPPLAVVHNPDAIGGSDWATTVKGDPWDMNALSDIVNSHNVTSPGIVSDGVTNAFQATATTVGDPVVELLVGGQQIDTSRFRTLTFALTLDTPFGLAPPSGSVARVFWERLYAGSNGFTETQDIVIWPGRNVYTIDLSQLTVTNGGLETECVPQCQQLPWNAGAIRYLRIDPHESTLGVRFRLGAVQLTAPDEVAIGTQFAVQYAFADADSAGSAYQARIYIGPNRSPGSRVLLDTVTSGVLPNRTLTYMLDPAGRGIPAGEYFVYVEIVETRGGIVDARGIYSSGPLRVGTGSAGAAPPGSPALVAVQTSSNPVTIAWSPGAGGAPTNYTLVAGTSPGTTNLGAYNLGLLTQISGSVPPGLPIYVRVVASNAVGSAVSNEIGFVVGGTVAPAPPRLNPAAVSDRTVSLSWSPTGGGAPSYYVVLARVPGNPNVVAAAPVAGTALTVPGVPPGAYIVSVVAVNAAGPSLESNAIVVSVP